MDHWKKSGGVGLICKIDLEKSYDRVDWGFLKWVLIKKGFHSKWINWIMGCTSNPWFSILINGMLKGFFCASRGIRQGDPLSPFLFALVGDALSALLSHALQANLVEGFMAPMKNLSISHL